LIFHGLNSKILVGIKYLVASKRIRKNINIMIKHKKIILSNSKISNLNQNQQLLRHNSKILRKSFLIFQKREGLMTHKHLIMSRWKEKI